MTRLRERATGRIDSRMLRGRELLLPFAVADTFVRFATLRIDDLLGAMKCEGAQVAD